MTMTDHAIRHVKNSANGVSPASIKLQSISNSVIDDFLSVVSRDWQTILKNECETLLEECSNEGWDGYDAAPLTSDSIRIAKEFVSMIPFEILPPDITPTPNGFLSFDWQNNSAYFSVTAEPEQGLKHLKLIYAVILGNQENRHGEVIISSELPPVILKILEDYFANRG